MVKASMIIDLKNRKIVKVEGTDKYSFLQGLITNDINKVDKAPIYTAFLSAQGKFLFDFFICKINETFYLTPEKNGIENFIKKLKIYKLRSDVQIELLESWSIYADLYMEQAPTNLQENHIRFLDPRDKRMGGLILSSENIDSTGTMGDYDLKRINLCIPDGSRDMPVDKAIILENRLDELQAIDWNKGCYLGQELMARTKHRGLIRKTLMVLEFDELPAKADETLFLDGIKAGRMRTSYQEKGLALMRIETANKSKSENKELVSDSGKKAKIIS